MAGVRVAGLSVYVCMCACFYVFVYVHACVYFLDLMKEMPASYGHVCIRTCVYVCMYLCIHMHACICST